jgi:hypothetical protein
VLTKFREKHYFPKKGVETVRDLTVSSYANYKAEKIVKTNSGYSCIAYLILLTL